MARLLWFIPILIVVLSIFSPQRVEAAETTTIPAVDPKAIESLGQMGEYLNNLQSFSAHIQTMRDLMLPSDEALVSSNAFDLTVQRPDKLRIYMTSAARTTEVFYNGKTITIYSPQQNFYATHAAPGNIEEVVQAALKRGISIPLADLLIKNADRKLLANVQSAIFVGSSLIDGIATNQLAFRQPGIDWQIWIEQGDVPLPVQLMIIDKCQKNWPRFMATISDWDTSPVIDQSTFSFVRPPGAKEIDFAKIPIRPDLVPGVTPNVNK